MKLLLFAVGLFTYFVFHSLLADSKVKILLQSYGVSKKYYRLGYNFIAVFLLFPLAWVYSSISSTPLFENRWIHLIGIFLIPVGVLSLILALRQYDLSEFSGIEQFNSDIAPKRQKLKTTGLNAWVRHPLYFASLLLLWGFFLYHPVDLVLVLVLVTTFYIYIGTKLEERKLIDEFGKEYQEYQQGVPMLLPINFMYRRLKR